MSPSQAIRIAAAELYRELPEPVKYRRYTVVHHSAECECRYCGGPLYVGDNFIASDNGEGDAFCTRLCAEHYTGLTAEVVKGPALPVGR